MGKAPERFTSPTRANAPSAHPGAGPGDPNPRLTLRTAVPSLAIMIRKRLCALAGILILAVGAASAQVPVPFNGIQAIVNDTVITRDQVLGTAQRELAAAARTSSGEDDYLRRRAKVLEDQLEQLIDRQLIVDEFKEKGYGFPDSLIDDMIKLRVKKDFGGDRVALTKTLRAENRTYEQFKKEEKEDFIIFQMTLKNIRDELVISPRKMERYYETNSAKFKVGNRVKLRMIVIDRAKHATDEAPKIAEKALQRLKAGEDFSKVADELSDDARRFKGGDRGWTEESSLREELRKVAFSLPAGQLSEIIDVQGTRFILKAEEQQPAGLKPLPEVRQEVENILKDSERQRLQKQWLSRLRKKAFVRYF